MGIFLVHIMKNRKVRRTFLVNAGGVETANEIMHRLNAEESVDGEPIFFKDEILAVAPVEFERDVMEI